MSEVISRRSILKVAGIGAGGLGLAASAEAAAVYRAGSLSMGEMGRLPRVAVGARPTDRAALGREDLLKLASAPAPASRLVERRLSAGRGLEDLGLDVVQVAAEFVCDPRRPNVLLDGATRITYEVVEVAWQAGDGWPIYRERSPHSEPAFGMRYAGVPRHQVVFLDDRALFVGHPGLAGVLTDLRGPLRVDVNGDAHESHRGFYKIWITGIA